MYVKSQISELLSMYEAKAEIDRRKAQASYRRGEGGVVWCGAFMTVRSWAAPIDCPLMQQGLHGHTCPQTGCHKDSPYPSEPSSLSRYPALPASVDDYC